MFIMRLVKSSWSIVGGEYWRLNFLALAIFGAETFKIILFGLQILLSACVFHARIDAGPA